MNDLSHLPIALRIQLEDVARRFRRYRNQRALVQASLRLLGLAAIYALGAFALRGQEDLLWWCTLAFALTGAAVFVRWGVLPCLRPLNAKQLALYLDAHYPALQNRMVTILELPIASDTQWLAERLIHETENIAMRLPLHDATPRVGVPKRLFSILVLAGVVFGLVYLLENGLPAPTQSTEAAPVSPAAKGYEVQPGDVKVRSGSNQMILVSAPVAESAGAIQWRLNNGSWTTAALESSTAKDVQYFEFKNVTMGMEYQVQVGKWRSEAFDISVWTPPEVEQINLTYHYPEYLQLPIREMPDGGEISAVEGTRVQLSIAVNKPLATVELLLDSGEKVALAEGENGEWLGELVLAKSGGYGIHLRDSDDNKEDYTPRYKIRVQEDEAPKVRVAFPRGDGEAHALEEVPFEFAVSDDFGLASYGIQFEVAGREAPVVVTLDEAPDPLAAIEEEYLLALETMGLEAGDFVTWSVWAKDRKPDRSGFETLGDPYFMEIRPFKRTFREALSNQGGGAGAGANQQATDQKQILIAIWNLRRGAEDMDAETFRGDGGTIAEKQGELLTEVQGAMMQASGEDMLLLKELTDEMQAVIEYVEKAALPDPVEDLTEAMRHGQNAHALALRLKPDEGTIQQQQGQGSGGSAGGSSPEIDALELDRRKDFHEEQTTMEQQEEEMSDLLDRLKELARRQDLLNADLAKLLSELEKDDAAREELERQLEQLKEEQRRNVEQLDALAGELASSSLENEQVRAGQQSLEEARESMVQSQRSMEQESLQQARRSGQQALNDLNEMEDKMLQLSQRALQAQLERLREDWSEIEERQGDIGTALGDLQAAESAPGLDNLDALESEKEGVLEERLRQQAKMEQFMDRAAELAERVDEAQPVASRKLNDWLRETSQRGLREEMEEGAKLMQYGIWDSAQGQEAAIAEALSEAGDALDALQRMVVEDDVDAMEKAMEQLEQIAAQAGAAGHGAETGEEEEESPSAATAPGETPGEEAGEAGEDGRGGEPGENPGQRGEPGTEPGQANGRGQSPGENPGQGQSEGAPSEGAQGGAGQSGAPSEGGQGGSMANPAQGWGGPGGGIGGPVEQLREMERGGPWSAERMAEFLEEEAPAWSERLRDARDLLPEDAQGRIPLERAEAGLERFRSQGRREGLAPRFDLLLEDTIKPLVQAVEAISEELAVRRGELVTLIQDDSRVPAQYQDAVDQYFEALATLPVGIQETP